jgi:hypothetical protein
MKLLRICLLGGFCGLETTDHSIEAGRWKVETTPRVETKKKECIYNGGGSVVVHQCVSPFIYLAPHPSFVFFWMIDTLVETVSRPCSFFLDDNRFVGTHTLDTDDRRGHES